MDSSLHLLASVASFSEPSVVISVLWPFSVFDLLQQVVHVSVWSLSPITQCFDPEAGRIRQGLEGFRVYRFEISFGREVVLVHFWVLVCCVDTRGFWSRCIWDAFVSSCSCWAALKSSSSFLWPVASSPFWFRLNYVFLLFWSRWASKMA